MQYKVPQNIDLEDKIVGPFTMRQFLYLFVGGFILYGWWGYASDFVSPSPMVIFIPIGLPVGLLAFCLAIVKINDRPFEYFLVNLFRFIFSPKQRKWITGYTPEAVITMDPIEAQQKKEVEKTTSDLDSLAKTLEKQTADIKQELPKPSVPAEKPSAINLSVKDVNQAAEKQQTAQSTQAPKKNGLLSSLFK